MSAPRPLPALHRIAPRVFYGWFVAVGCGLVSFAVVGVGFYGLVVFLDALVTDRGWDRGTISAATSLYWIVTALTGTAIGRSVDRFGARGFMATGVFLMALGLLAVGHAREPWQVFVAYPVLAAGFAMAGSVTNGAIVTRWFEARRARAMTVAQTGVSLGGILLVPLATRWIGAVGLEEATRRLALLLLGITLPVLLFVVRFDPAGHGLAPDGAPRAPRSVAGQAQRVHLWSRREILATATFRRLAAAYALMLFGQVGVAMHEIALLRERMDTALAAGAVSLTAFGSLSARLLVGSFADRVEKRRLAAALFLFQGAAVAVLALGDHPAVLLGAALAFGFTVGNIFMLQSLLVAELFGMGSFATALGVQQAVSQVASGLGPVAVGLAAGAFGGYRPALGVLVVLAAVAAFLVAGVPRPEPPEGAAAAPEAVTVAERAPLAADR